MLEDRVKNFEYVMHAWQKHMKEDPKSVMLSDSLGTKLTRTQVDDMSNRVHAYLKSKNIGRNDFVLICLDRGVKPVIAVYGVWKNGSAFSLVESNYAKDRIDFIAKDCNAQLRITEDIWDEIMAMEPEKEYVVADDHDAAFCVYTSGTTGTPKGVMHEYGQIKMEMLSDQLDDGTWKFNRKTRFGLVAPLNFVATVKIFVEDLYVGGKIFVLDYDTIKNPKKLSAYLLKNKIDGIFMSPSLIRIKGDYYGPFMKYIYTGSEPANDISIKNAKLYNIYTMSESMFTVCQFLIDKPYPVVPIGNPRFELPIKLLNEKGEEVKEGEIGEFCFYNPYCRGYVHNDKENRRHFIEGYFHTGDLAVYENGEYLLKGRSDDMIKIAGNRIEPSEIEAACNDVMQLNQSIAKGFEKEGIVVLYYMEDIDFDEEEVRKKLEEKLPYYMIPSYFVKIDKVPVSKTGKIDKKALLLPTSILKAEYVAPRNEFEETLSNKFTEILKIDHIGIDDDFFKLGGESLKVMSLLSIIEDEILTPTMIYNGRTIRKISELYEQEKLTHLSVEEKEKIGREANYPISENMKWYWDNVNDGTIDFYSCFKLAPYIPTKVILNRLNNYVEKNSIFDMVLVKGKNDWPIQACIKKHYVEVEHMSKKELEALFTNFVHPFGYGEPLVRLRLIKSGLNTYLFFHAFHMITDGAGAHLMIEDLNKALNGQEIDPIYYFAWAFDENVREQSKNIPKNYQYFKKTYFDKNYDICIKTDKNTGESGMGMAGTAKINLSLVQDYCSKKEISINTFLISSYLLVQSAYNKSDLNMATWNFNNRGPNDTHAGVMIRTAYCAIDRSLIHSLDDLYKTINQQNQENLRRLYESEFYKDFEKAKYMPCTSITYLEDWFTGARIPKLVGTELTLNNNSDISEDAEKVFVLECTHNEGNLCIDLSYGKSYLTTEHAQKFIRMMEYSMNHIVQDILPDFK